MNHDHYVGQVSTNAEDRIFEGFLNRNLYQDGNAAVRNQWFYTEGNTSKFLFFKRGVIAPIGAMGFNSRMFNTPVGLKMGAVAADLCIDKEYRDVQSALNLVEIGVISMLHEVGVDFVYTIPNRSSKAIVKRTGIFQSAGVFERHVKLISFGEVLKDKKCRFITPVVDKVWSAVSRIHNVPKLINNDVTSDSSFSEADDIWHIYNNSEMVIGTRDKNYLKWRYRDNNESKYEAFRVTHNGKHAYLVYMIIKNRAYVVDLLYPKNDDTILLRLFAEFESLCHYNKYSMIVIQHLGCQDAINVLTKKLWYRRYTPSNKELFVSSEDGNLLNCLTTGEKYWFAGDEDDIQ